MGSSVQEEDWLADFIGHQTSISRDPTSFRQASDQNDIARFPTWNSAKKSPNTFFSKEGRGGFCRNLKMTRSMPSCEPHPPDSTNSSGARTVPASFADGDAFAQRHRPRHWILPSMGLLAQQFPAGAPAPQ